MLFTRSVALVGTYSVNTTVDVSAFGASSASEFIATCPTNTNTNSNGWYIQHVGTSGYCANSGSYTAPTLSLSGNTLTVTVGRVGESHTIPSRNGSSSKELITNVYYVGDVS